MIDADELILELMRVFGNVSGYERFIIKNQETKPAKQRWLFEDDGECRCPRCRMQASETNYCPNCGIKLLPSVKPHWILHDVQCQEQYECSSCGARYIYERNEGCDKWEHCPSCGTKMRGWNCCG